MRYSNNIQKLLDQKGWSPKHLMRIINVTKMTVWRWTHNKCNPEKQHLKLVAEALGVKQSEIINVIDD